MEEKAYELEALQGRARSPRYCSKESLCRVWQCVIPWIQNEYREEVLPRSEFLFTSIILWIKGRRRALMLRWERGAPVWQWGAGEEEREEDRCRRRARKTKTEIPVTYDKRDNGLSNYPAERLNRAATPKSVLSASFFSLYVFAQGSRELRRWDEFSRRLPRVLCNFLTFLEKCEKWIQWTLTYTIRYNYYDKFSTNNKITFSYENKISFPRT